MFEYRIGCVSTWWWSRRLEGPLRLTQGTTV